MSPHLVAVGSLFQDTLFRVPQIPDSPRKVLATERRITIGGMAPNAAIAARRLGASVALWSRVGDDPAGEQLLAQLDAEGIDRRAVRRCVAVPTPGSAILIDERGERLVCAFPSPSLPDDTGHLPVAELRQARGVLADARWPQASALALAAAREAGRIAMLDADLAPFAVLDELAGQATHLVCSQAGLAVLLGREDPPGTPAAAGASFPAQPARSDSTAAGPVRDAAVDAGAGGAFDGLEGCEAPEARSSVPRRVPGPAAAALRELLLRYPGLSLAAVTLGESGVCWLSSDDLGAGGSRLPIDRLWHLPAWPVRAVDTLGAGDAFHGGLLVGLARGMAVDAAMHLARVVAGLKCARFGGGAAAPDAEQVAAAMAI